MRCGLVAFVASIVLASAAAALGQSNAISVRVKPTPATAPIALIACESRGANALAVRVGNRSTHVLSAVTYRLRLYDSQGARFADTPLTQSVPLDPGEVGIFTAYLTAQADARSLVCSLVGANFEDGGAWTSGQPWHGRLVTIARPNVAGAGAVTSSGGDPVIRATGKEVWTSIVYGLTYVHVRTQISARRAVTVSPAEFHALIPLAEGGARSVAALSGAVPSVTKTSSLNSIVPSLSSFGSNNSARPIVEPTEDFGALGHITLRAGESVTTVITFQTPGVDDSALQRLSILWEPSAY
jgi:hypothetical protein